MDSTQNGSQAAAGISFFIGNSREPGSGDLRQQLAIIFDHEQPRSLIARLFNSAPALLILVNVCCVILESIEPIRQRLALSFALSEHAATVIFAVEYGLRVRTCVDFHEPRYRDPLRGWLHYIHSLALVRIVAEPFLRHCRMMKPVTHR